MVPFEASWEQLRVIHEACWCLTIKPVDLVLQVDKVLLVRARRTTGLAGFFASEEASEQESPVDDVTSRLVMQSSKKPAASSEHWHCGPCTGSFGTEVPCQGVSRD